MGRTDVIVDELDFGQRERVVDAHVNGGLHHDVYKVHDLVPEEERPRPQPCTQQLSSAGIAGNSIHELPNIAG